MLLAPGRLKARAPGPRYSGLRVLGGFREIGDLGPMVLLENDVNGRGVAFHERSTGFLFVELHVLGDLQHSASAASAQPPALSPNLMP